MGDTHDDPLDYTGPFPANDDDTHAAESPRDADDTFNPTSVPDRFNRRVRTDHAPNAALHAALKATRDFESVDLMADHAPGEKPTDPWHHVTIRIENSGAGLASTGSTILRELIDRDDVVVTRAESGSEWAVDPNEPGVDAAESHTDVLIIDVRPVATRVEPIYVPYDDIPDRFESPTDTRVGPLPTYEERGQGFPQTRPPIEPIREWVRENNAMYDVSALDRHDVGVEIVAEMIADAIENHVVYGDVHGDPERIVEFDPDGDALESNTTVGHPVRGPNDAPGFRDVDPSNLGIIACGCGDYSVTVPSTPDVISVKCPECGHYFGHDGTDD